MVVYSFYIFDRHGKILHASFWAITLFFLMNMKTAECIYKRRWPPSSASTTGKTSRPSSQAYTNGASQPRTTLSAEDDAKLIFGTVFSLRNMVRKLGGPDDSFISFRTGQYKLHYYETVSSIKFVMLTDTMTLNMRNVLHQIYVNLYVEFGRLYLSLEYNSS